MSGSIAETSAVTDAAAGGRVLREALEQATVEHPDGRKVRLTANISRPDSDALRRFVSGRKPRAVVEIGMAHGVSTLSILIGLAEGDAETKASGGPDPVGPPRLYSIDPYVGWPTGRRIALHQVERAGLTHLHEHLHVPSHLGLPRLIERGVQPDLVYIDGCHDYPYAFTDFFLSDQMLGPGGVVAFNNAGWPSVHRVIRHLQRRGDYRELDVGLPRRYRGRNVLYSMARWMRGMPTQDRYFQKV